MAKKLNDSKRNIFTQQLRSSIWMLDLIQVTYKNIVPFIYNGKNVIVDRYTLCNKVYMEVLNGDSINYMCNALDYLPQPDLGIYLNISVEEAVIRISKRDITVAPYENKEVLQKIKNRYEEHIEMSNFPVYSIDASKNIDEVAHDALSIISHFGGGIFARA